MTITNPLYSFVQFNAGAQTLLPVVLATDLKFQLVMTGTISEANALHAASVTVNIVKSTGVIDSDASLTANLLIAGTLFFLPYRISATEILLYWSHGAPGVTSLPIETCFRLAFKIAGVFYVSNIFKLIAANKYSSTLEYSCDENNNGFHYCFDDLPNKIRLPLYINKPQFPDDENIYVRSDGSIDMLSSVTKKEYEGRTDYLNEAVHQKIKIALSQDHVAIASNNYTGGIRKNGNYEIEWPDYFEDEEQSEIGRASFKVYATPFDIRNSNCAECEAEYVLPG